MAIAGIRMNRRHGITSIPVSYKLQPPSHFLFAKFLKIPSSCALNNLVFFLRIPAWLSVESIWSQWKAHRGRVLRAFFSPRAAWRGRSLFSLVPSSISHPRVSLPPPRCKTNIYDGESICSGASVKRIAPSTRCLRTRVWGA